MGLFSGGAGSAAATSGTTIIAAGTVFDGTLELSCNLHVDGEITGTVRCLAEVTIGRKGLVKGDLEASSLVVSGTFDGECSVNSLEICKTGRVLGEMKAAELVVAKGGYFRGHCSERGDATEPAETNVAELKDAANKEQSQAS